MRSLVFALCLCISGCAAWDRAVNCAAPGLAEDAALFAPAVRSALSNEPNRWQPAVDLLYRTGGTAVLCAIRALAGFETAGAPLRQDQIAERARIWLARREVRK